MIFDPDSIPRPHIGTTVYVQLVAVSAASMPFIVTASNARREIDGWLMPLKGMAGALLPTHFAPTYFEQVCHRREIGAAYASPLQWYWPDGREEEPGTKLFYGKETHGPDASVSLSPKDVERLVSMIIDAGIGAETPFETIERLVSFYRHRAR